MTDENKKLTVGRKLLWESHCCVDNLEFQKVQFILKFCSLKVFCGSDMRHSSLHNPCTFLKLIKAALMTKFVTRNDNFTVGDLQAVAEFSLDQLDESS